MADLPKIQYLEEVRNQPHICLAEGLRAATRAVARIYARHLGNAELGVAQTSTMMRLYYLREPTMSELSAELETDRTTMTRNVEVLARKGLVRVGRGTDRRERVVSLTERGHSALNEVLPRWRSAQEELREQLGERAWQEVLRHTRGLSELDRVDGCDGVDRSNPP